MGNINDYTTFMAVKDHMKQTLLAESGETPTVSILMGGAKYTPTYTCTKDYICNSRQQTSIQTCKETGALSQLCNTVPSSELEEQDYIYNTKFIFGATPKRSLVFCRY